MEDRKKIVMVVACAFPANHGTPASIIEMCNQLQDAGHDVHVVTYYKRDYEQEFLFPVHRVSSWRAKKQGLNVGPSWERLWFDFLLVFKTISVVFKVDPDVIHAHNYEGQLVGFVASVLTRRPLVYHAHNTMIDELPQYEGFVPKSILIIFSRFLDYVVPRLADHIIAISKNLDNFFAEKGVGPGKVSVIPLSVTSSIFVSTSKEDICEKYNLPTRHSVIYTGTLDRFQRIDYLTEAFHQVLQVIPQASLVLVVNKYKHEQFEQLKESCRVLKMNENVHIILTSPLEDLLSIIKACDVGVIPRPDCPGFPIKALNYMAAGIPVAAFAGTANFLDHGINGLLAKDHDINELAGNITTLLSDTALCNQLGDRAKMDYCKLAESFSGVSQIVDVYEQVISC